MPFWIRKDATKGERVSPKPTSHGASVSATSRMRNIISAQRATEKQPSFHATGAAVHQKGRAPERLFFFFLFFRLSGKQCGGYAVSPAGQLTVIAYGTLACESHTVDTHQPGLLVVHRRLPRPFRATIGVTGDGLTAGASPASLARHKC